jgi:Phage portal protein, SPP1 Gp6-like.
MNNYLQQILTYFRNLTLNASGVSRDLYQLLQDKDISRALDMLQNRDDEVDQAIKEYNPQTHDVMKRPNKFRKGDDPYITEKLPRTRARYINDIELFFLLGNPIEWKKEEGDDEAFSLFTDFLEEQHFNSRIRQAKRLAGAETESALIAHIYRDDDTGERRVKLNVLARSKGYRLRPLFDTIGNMTAFAYGYVTKEHGRSIQHWDFQTPKILAYCRKAQIGWEVEIYPNPTGKINVIYFQQPKAWDGAEARINREEMLDSKTGDTNNYFSDPTPAATADVIQTMTDPNKPGKLIQLTGEKSRFEYVNPPQASQTRDAEKSDLSKSILFDTYTPDFDTEAMRGFGTLSGVAIRNAFILGYIKRDNRKEIYDELVGRFRNIVIAILAYEHPDKRAALEALKIKFEFAEPFADDKQAKWQSIASLYQAGLISLETAVTMLSLTDAPEEEIARLLAASAQKQQQGQQPSANKEDNPAQPPVNIPREPISA